jgi:hypothetical protein
MYYSGKSIFAINQPQMTISNSVSLLKQQFEHLFPGKWVNANNGQRTLLTGLGEIDQSFARGIARQRITEWMGSSSSGKTSILRTIIKNWCTSGFSVAYVDVENKLIAADWIFSTPGKFWVIRNLEVNSPTPHIHTFTKYKIKRSWKNRSLKQNHFWATDELIRTSAFDVVILDLGSSDQTNPICSRIYARLQNSLARSKTALIIVRNVATNKDNLSLLGWGSYAQFYFQWGQNIQFLNGLKGKTIIEPSINCTVVKDGLHQSKEIPEKILEEDSRAISIFSNVTNCLFTHPPAADRRSSKT